MKQRILFRFVIFFTLILVAVVSSSDTTKDYSNLRGGRQRDQDQQPPHRLFAFFFKFIDLIRGWMQRISQSSTSREEDALSTSGDSSTLFDNDKQHSLLQQRYNITRPPKAVLLDPQQLKEAGMIARRRAIVGGSNADPSEAPFYAMILTWSDTNKQWEYIGCGGTLISNKHILTAGHCAVGRDVKYDAVYVHAFQPFLGNPGVAFHYSKVLSYTVHPNFDDGPNDSDVAIVTMQDELDISNFPPIPLEKPSKLASSSSLSKSTPKLKDGDLVSVYGFGRKSASDESQVDTLQSVKMPFISRTACKDYYGSQVLADMVCAMDAGKDACSGDSGGPMVATSSKNQVYQVALVSWGDGCADSSKPGVYTSVQYHYEWIQSTVCSDPNVDRSIDLCNSEASHNLMTMDVFQPVAQASIQSSNTNNCKRKSLGQSCTYGGQCCSGSCGTISRFSSSPSWVCTEAASSSRLYNSSSANAVGTISVPIAPVAASPSASPAVSGTNNNNNNNNSNKEEGETTEKQHGRLY